ncbi:MAG: thioesterase domain-containing protein, partial [Gammaproteobacteria bacterium]|nr:thioesterase domain-containing protein [Gammaproteobacteria bacterium]
EYQIRQLPDIEDAVVVDKPFEHENLLVAYVRLKNTTQSGSSIDVIKNQLKDILPAVMVPSKIVVLEEFPLNNNGKIDRRALEQIDLKSNEFSKPLGDVNAAARVRHLMSQIIGDEIVSDLISFFDCGGTSLSVVRLVDSLNDEFKQSLNVADVYQNPTAKQLATCINTKSGRDDWLSVTPIQTKGNNPPLFFSYGNAQKLASTLGDEFTVYWVVHGKHGTVVPTAPIVELAKQHLEQIKSEQPRGPYYLGGFSVGAYVILEVARLFRHQGEEVAMLALLDPTSPQHYVVRSRWQRVLGFVRQPYPLDVRVRYLIGLLRRLLGALRRRFLHSTPHIDTNISTNVAAVLDNATLTSSQKLTRSEILRMVEDVMRNYVFKACPGRADLVRLLNDSAHSLEWWDEEVFWREFFTDGIDTHYIQSTGNHNDLFRDQSALVAFADWLKERMKK